MNDCISSRQAIAFVLNVGGQAFLDSVRQHLGVCQDCNARIEGARLGLEISFERSGMASQNTNSTTV